MGYFQNLVNQNRELERENKSFKWLAEERGKRVDNLITLNRELIKALEFMLNWNTKISEEMGIADTEESLIKFVELRKLLAKAEKVME